MHRRLNRLSLALAVLASIVLSAPAVAGELVPLRGTLEGLEVSLTPPPLVQIDAVGGGQSVHLGRYTYNFQATVDFSHTPPNPPKGMGTLVLTAANGDTIVAEVMGSSVPVIPGQLILITEEAIIVDGTGRFAGATGAFTLTRLKYQDSGLTIGTFEGGISTVGGGNP